MPADLHVHTTCSDSTLTPQDVIQECLWSAIDTVAIADHDTIEGIEPATEAGRQVGVRVVPGVELSAYEGDLEVHLVGLFIGPRDPALADILSRSLEERHRRVFEIVKRLSQAGIDLPARDVFEIADGGSPGRPHVARAMVNRGHVASIQDAFRYYIGAGCAAYVPKYRLSVEQARDAIHGSGGVSIIAHPGDRLDAAAVADLVRRGIDGIEAYHPLHSYEKERKYLRLADELGALVAGGSDSHGTQRDWARIGIVRIENHLVARLEERALSRRGPT